MLKLVKTETKRLIKRSVLNEIDLKQFDILCDDLINSDIINYHYFLHIADFISRNINQTEKETISC